MNLSEALQGIPGLLVRDRPELRPGHRSFRSAASARAPASASAACACTWTTSRPRSPTGSRSSRTPTWPARSAWRCCAGRSRRCTATPRAAWCRCSAATARRRAKPASAPRRARAATGGCRPALRGAWRDVGVVAGLSTAARGRLPAAVGGRAAVVQCPPALAARGDGAAQSLVVNHFDSPLAQDPLGLSRAQFDADPYQTTPQAARLRHPQARAAVAGGLDPAARAAGRRVRCAALVYAGTRGIEQFLAIPVGVQANPLQSGGVVDLDSDYGGGELRLAGDATLAGRALEWTAGAGWEGLRAAAPRLRELRRQPVRRARCAAARRAQPRGLVRPVRAGRLAPGRALVAAGGAAPQPRSLRFRRPLRGGRQPRRQRRGGVLALDPGGGAAAARQPAPAPARQRRQRHSKRRPWWSWRTGPMAVRA